MRRSSEINKEMAYLAHGNKSKKLAPGLKALEVHLSELRGRLQVEMNNRDFEELPEENELTTDIQEHHAEGARLAAEIKAAEAELAGPREVLVLADEALKRIRERSAELNGTISTKKADLDAGRASFSDGQLSINAEGLEREAAAKSKLLEEKERDQGESPEAINARIAWLEDAATNHQNLISRLENELTRLENMFDVLMRAGKIVQIIVLTCRKQLFTRLGAAPLEIRETAWG